MKVAVTGARGFVGRHVLAELERRDIEVVASARPGSARRDGPSGARVRWIEADIHEAGQDCFDTFGRPDVMIHLAWGGLPNYRSLHHFESELPAHYAFLARMVRAGLPALVCTGTCFEYGLQSGPLTAATETRPGNAYGLAKDTLRKQLQQLQATHPFALSWARLFYLYGEGQPESSLLPMLRRAVAAGDAKFSMSGGEQLRDYLPVGDVARCLVDLALNPRDRGPLNVCSGRPMSVRRLVERWIAENGWSIALDLGKLPYPDYEPLAFWGVPSPDAFTTPAER